MHKSTSNYIGAVVLSVSSAAFWQSETERVTTIVEQNIASTLKDACTWKESIEFLNCRLREPRDDRYANDAKIYAQMASVRNRWNLWLSQSPYLPFEMRQDRTWGIVTTTGWNTVIPQTHIAPKFLPKDVGLKWGTTGNIKIEYRVPFAFEKWLSSSSSEITPPPILMDRISPIAQAE